MTDPQADLELIALHRGDHPRVRIVPASRWREWMNATSDRVANRCLPLLVANQTGWVMLNPAPLEASWDGGEGTDSLVVTYGPEVENASRIAASHFGHGILTFAFECVFRTPAGYNLHARGPANAPKDGIGPLEGVIETDWAIVPFSMNWKFTRPGSVSFSVDEPFCQVMPIRRGELERFRPQHRQLDEDGTMRLRAWEGARGMVMLGKQLAQKRGDERWSRLWLHDYFKGRTPSGESSDEHQTQLRLRPFSELPPS